MPTMMTTIITSISVNPRTRPGYRSMVTPHFDGCIVENPALPGAAMLTSGALWWHGRRTLCCERVAPCNQRVTNGFLARIGGILDADPAAVGEHDVHGAAAGAAQRERAHLQATAEEPRVAEGRVRHDVGDRLVAADRDALGCPALDAQRRVVRRGLTLQIGVRVDEPARLEAARFGTVDTIKGLAHIYAGIALDGFRTRKLQRPAQQLSLTVQPVRPQVRTIRGHTETGHEGQDRQRQQ